jgi:hypothetical protein
MNTPDLASDTDDLDRICHRVTGQGIGGFIQYCRYIVHQVLPFSVTAWSNMRVLEPTGHRFSPFDN